MYIYIYIYICTHIYYIDTFILHSYYIYIYIHIHIYMMYVHSPISIDIQYSPWMWMSTVASIDQGTNEINKSMVSHAETVFEFVCRMTYNYQTFKGSCHMLPLLNVSRGYPKPEENHRKTIGKPPNGWFTRETPTKIG